MEEAYLAALDKVGGLEAAKPRAILDELQTEFPHLTLQARAPLETGRAARLYDCCAAGACALSLLLRTWQGRPCVSGCAVECAAITRGARGTTPTSRGTPPPAAPRAPRSLPALPPARAVGLQVAPAGAPPPHGAAQTDGPAGHRAAHQVDGPVRRRVGSAQRVAP